MNKKLQPIGILDSGLGGLTITKSLSQSMPAEEIIYLADNLHSPNGEQSKDTITQNSLKAIEFLISAGCKVIVIVCNSISANAIDEIVNIAGARALILNVIDPVVEYIANSGFRNVGIIGTRSTIETNVYDEKINKLNKGMMISSMVTPLLVPIIEEGSIYDEISNTVIKTYFSRHELRDIEALIPGNNHYSALKNQLNKFYNFDVEIVDTAMILADKLLKILKENQLMNDSEVRKQNRYFVTELTPHQMILAKMFFEMEILLEWVKL